MINAANKGIANPHIKNRLRLVQGMVEDPKVQADVLKSGKVDTIISEPIGVMILHERMVRPQSLD
jgi:histone-arginine methyltransferase CARM1